MIAMILAAGRGERLKPLTDSIPKALVEVHGQSLLERHLEKMRDAGIKDVVINLGWLGEKIVERVGTGSAYGLNVSYSDETGNVLETGGGIYKALPLLGDETFLVVNADILTDMPIPNMVLQDDALAHLVLVPKPDYRDHGDFDLRDGRVCNSAAPELTYSGFTMYRPEFFATCKPGRFSVAPMFRKAADAGQLQGSLYEGRWADIGTAERLAALQSEYRSS
ncbi:MAG: nucleotidyltransferase family protein [Gammaproteobacteria bacterium]|nr:nucleotidyltransferase family protein [Gammaproteobacteria bacterium]